MGFVRLSILDLSPSGHQPMQDPAGRYTLTHNGEVYNYIELREELEKKGYAFESGTDTEVILKSYMEWGESCLERFNGMWSFAIYDRVEKKLFVARDRYGIKPFYYYLDGEKFIYASEIQPILAVLSKSDYGINNQALFDYLVFNRTDQTEDTFFSNIRKLQHGHTLTIRNGQLKIDRWYDLRKKLDNPFTDQEEYLECLTSAVNLRLRSDVPVGLSLSGGLDSSSLASVLIHKLNESSIYTFSAVYGAGQTGDESLFIDEYRSQLPRMFFTRPTAESFFADMDSFISIHGEPIPRTGPYVQYKVMELARDYVVVTLDGQGADEQLAGYQYFFGFYFKDLLKRLQLARFFEETTAYLRNHKSLFGLQTMAYLMLPKSMQAGVKMMGTNYLDRQFFNQYKDNNIITDVLYASASLQDALLNHFELKLEHLLKWEDRNSMWFSLESRVPFLDYRLVERTLALKPDAIIKKGNTKYILREAMKGLLPEAIRVRQDKIGFGNPENEWYRSPQFKELILDLLNSRSFRELGFFNVEKAQRLYQKHLNRELNIAKEIWKWVNVSKWVDFFIK